MRRSGDGTTASEIPTGNNNPITIVTTGRGNVIRAKITGPHRRAGHRLTIVHHRRAGHR